jgi:exonuclease SbcC
MRPLQLMLKGFTSFKDEVSLGFERLDLFVISGATGAGKSSLLDAMTYALFGQVPRTNDHGLRELISHGRDRMAVVLDFQVGGQPYRVARGRRRNGPTQVQLEKLAPSGPVPVADKVRTVDEEVRRLLGLGFDAFTQAVVLPQGQFAAFLKSEPRDRRKMLNGLLRLHVYERMRDLAGGRESALEHRKASVERRLREDFEGVTAEAAVQLRNRQAVVRDEVADSWHRLTGAQERLAVVRREHEKTGDLAARESELAELQKHEPAIEALGRQLEAAQRAAQVIPLLDQADRARQDQQRRADELAQARQDHAALHERHLLAQEALARARQVADTLPSLRDRQGELAEVLGKLPHRDQLNQQCTDQQNALDQLRQRREQCHVRRRELSEEAAALGDHITQAMEQAARIGYDPVFDQKLASTRDRANRLHSERGRIDREAEGARRKGREAAHAEAACNAAAGRKEHAEWAKQEADHDLTLARTRLEEANKEYAAAHLRTGLVAGQACPVCRQEVRLLPHAEPVPLLEQLQADVERTNQSAHAAAQEAMNAATDFAAIRATATSARQQADEAETALHSLQAAVGELDGELQTEVGKLVAGFAGQTIEARILAAVNAVEVQRAEHEKIGKALTDLDRTLQLKRQAADTATTEAQQLETSVAEGDERLRRLQEALKRVHDDIRAVTEEGDPRTEQKRVADQIKGIEEALQDSVNQEAEAARCLGGAAGKADQLQSVAADAARDADEAARQASQAIGQSRFADAATARAAALPPETTATYRTQIEGHRQTLHTVQTRITELIRELGDRRVTDAELAQVEQEHAACQERHQAKQKEQTVVAEQLRTLEDKLARAVELRREHREVSSQHRVLRRLAGDLKSDCFQAYLLEEALGALVSGASQQLGRLTGDRYGLDYVRDQIVVIDRDNAGERRSTDTLSGGETFLASLSLALELSAQVQQAVGAIHLDCLFIDEGFGTLDPDTLRIVADAVRTLQVGGRMVGIITHIPELREEFDQRLVIQNEAGASRVRIETA